MAQNLLHGLDVHAVCSISVAAVWRSLCAEYCVESSPASPKCFFTSAWTVERLTRSLREERKRAF